MNVRICVWLGLGLLSTGAQAAPEIAQLYAPKLPEGSAYVRVVNPADTAMQVQVGQSASFSLSARSTVASPFQVVDSRQPLKLTVNGREIAGLSAPKGAWVTVILDSDPARAPRLVIDPPLRGKDLRAELNVYNLSSGCEKAEV
jgi:alginate O-acetyltransferase complex protein AlgF